MGHRVKYNNVDFVVEPKSAFRPKKFYSNVLLKVKCRKCAEKMWWEKKTRKYNLNIDQHFPFQYWNSLLKIALDHILFLYFIKALVQDHKT